MTKRKTATETKAVTKTATTELAEGIVIQKQLKLTRTDLIELAFHEQERSSREDANALRQEARELAERRRELLLASAKEAFSKTILKPLTFVVKEAKYDTDRRMEGVIYGVMREPIEFTFDIVTVETDETLILRKESRDLIWRASNAEARAKSTKDNRAAFKHEYIRRLLEQSEEGKRLLADVRSLVLNARPQSSEPEVLVD